MMVYTAIQATDAVWLKDSVLGIIFGPEGRTFNKMVVSKADNLEVIKNAAVSVLGKELTIKCMDSEDINITENNAEPVSNENDNSNIVDVAKQMAEMAGIEVDFVEE